MTLRYILSSIFNDPPPPPQSHPLGELRRKSRAVAEDNYEAHLMPPRDIAALYPQVIIHPLMTYPLITHIFLTHPLETYPLITHPLPLQCPVSRIILIIPYYRMLRHTLSRCIPIVINPCCGLSRLMHPVTRPINFL